MAIRQTRFQLKNNQNSAAPFSGTSLLVGEPIVNTAAGIMMFSGVTTGTNDWTPAGPGGNATFFEVGSNLYDLRLRNRITQYEGISGIGLVGKILSGTTSGLTLVDATNINGISAFTYTASANTFTIIDSNGTEYPATFTTVSGLTVNGDFTVTGNTFLNFLTANTISATTITVDDININDDATVSGDLTVNNLNVTGTTTISGGITADTISATTITTDDIYVNDDAFVSGDLTVHNLTVTGSTVLNTVTANTISATTITSDDINVNDDVNIGGDLSVTGNTVLQSVSATSFSATSINLPTLGANRVVYTTGSGLLTTESNFTYDEGTDTLGVNNIEASGDVTIQGSLTVFGASVSAFTTNLYVEDPNVFLNYNPTGSTTLTSVNAGFTIQDGSGVSGQNVNFDIVIMQDLTGLTSNQTPIITEYTGPTGYSNRGWITQLNDIIIRSTDPIDSPTGAGAINGVRVLAEFDVLDGGTY